MISAKDFPYSYADIADLAHECRKLIFDVEDIHQPFKYSFTREKIEKFGGKIFGFRGDVWRCSDSLLVRSVRDFVIICANWQTRMRDHRQLAHELGHIVLHLPQELHDGWREKPKIEVTWDDVDNLPWNTNLVQNYPLRFCRGFYPPIMDQQANYFARELLMPKEALDAVLKKYDNDWVLIPGYFGIDYAFVENIQNQYEEEELQRRKAEKSLWQIYC